jgi:hypothetical protein
MSLRDWFAGMAMQGLSANPAMINHTARMIAAISDEQADAMMEARKEATK